MRLFSLLALVLAGAPAAARAAVRGSAAERVLSAATLDASEQRQKLAPVEAAPRFAEATSQDVARAQLGMFPATIGIILVLKLVNAVASGFTEMHKQKSLFLTDAATEELADLRREAAREASELTALFDSAVGDLNTRYKDTIADLAVDMVNDKAFLTDANLKTILSVIRDELQLRRAGGGAKGGVHTLDELELLYSAAQSPDGQASTPPVQMDIFYSLLSAAMRREYDAVFSWTATPAETVLIKTLTPAFGVLAHKIAPDHPAELKGKIASQAQFDESLEANSGTLRHIQQLDDAYGRSLEEVFELVGDRKKEELKDKAKETSGEMKEALFEATMQIMETVAEDALDKIMHLSLKGEKAISKHVEDLAHAADFTITAVNALEIVAATVSALKSISQAVTASNEAAVAAFTSKRDVAVLRERVEVDKRLGLLNLCEMMSGLQEVLESFLATSDGKIESQAEEITRIVLGDAADKLSLDSAFHQKLARSFYARLCALLVPAHNRIAALFRGAGKCQSGAIAQYHTKADAKDKIQAQHYQEALKRPHIAMGSGESDIYDVQLIDGADVGAWKTYGYQVVGTELNADLCDTERGIGILNSCKPDTPPKKEDSRRFVYLLRRAIFDPNGMIQTMRGSFNSIADQKDKDFFRTVDAFQEPISDLTLVALKRGDDGELDSRDLEVRLEEGYIPLKLVRGGPQGLINNNVARLSLGYDNIKKAVAAAKEADLNHGRAGKEVRPPVIVPLVRRGGRTALIGIKSLPFHAMADAASKKEIALESSDLALAERSASKFECKNILTPDAGCQVFDLAVHKATMHELTGFFTKLANGLDRAFTLPRNKGSAKTQYYSHHMDTQCAKLTADSWPATWERLALSHKEGVPLAGEHKTLSLGHWRAELQRPYLWVQRRYALAQPEHAGAVVDLPACPQSCNAGLIESGSVRRDSKTLAGGMSAAVQAAYADLKKKVADKLELAQPVPAQQALVVSAAEVALVPIAAGGGWEKQPQDGGVWKGYPFTFRCAARLTNAPAHAEGVAVLTYPSSDNKKSGGTVVPEPGYATYELFPLSTEPKDADRQPHMCSRKGKEEECSKYNQRAANCLCIPSRVLGGVENGVPKMLRLVETSRSAGQQDSNQYAFQSAVSSKSNAVDIPAAEFTRQYRAFMDATKNCMRA